ncbi:hypothetical protein P8452_62156 [Trifolium repens]|nr:hypothetical protein P8452_62156 [Trifolium repens]
MNTNKRECSQLYLPKELWAIIFTKLKSTLDVVRFRSTCSLWHSFLPPPALSFNLRIPHRGYFLIQTKIYRIKPSPHDHDPSTSCSNNKGWLIKVFQSSNSSKFYLFDLFTNTRLPSNEIVKKVNLMNVQVVELFELYTRCDRYCAFAPISFVRKVILFSIEGHCTVFELYSDKMLRASNIGKMPLSILKDEGGENEHFDDIILYKEQPYVVDEMGTIFWINTLSLKLVQFSPKNFNCGEKRQIYNPNNKQLVEYDGNLYVVDIDDGRYYNYRMDCLLKGSVCVKVYKLDQEWGKWLDGKEKNKKQGRSKLKKGLRAPAVLETYSETKEFASD